MIACEVLTPRRIIWIQEETSQDCKSTDSLDPLFQDRIR